LHERTSRRISFITNFVFCSLLFFQIQLFGNPSLFGLNRLLQLLMPWSMISGRRSMLPRWLRWRTLWSHMTANSTLVTHGSFRSLPLFVPLNLPMWAVRSNVPWLATVMACERLSSDRKLDWRLRDDRYFPIHKSFSLIHD
jgi:predicted membrane protein